MRRPIVSATIPVGTSKITIPAVKNALAANASRLDSPASSRKIVLIPQMNDVASVFRNIRTLYNFEPPATDEEVREAALQYVRKISGYNKPSRANAEAFERAVDDVAAVTGRLLGDLVTSAPPKDREVEAAKRRARAEQRVATG